ncbi:hypothetical protein [Streptomyces sp. NPDC039016]|uniref:hypothetical protein n=1 Tax=unclassified Streptomyces TaxID=2593676 RepID=UPI0033FB9DC1
MTTSKHHQRAAEIIALYVEGVPVTQLQKRFGISAWALYEVLRRHHVPLRGKTYPESATSRAVAEYERLRSDGMTRAEIAEKFGIKPNTLYRALLRRRSRTSH